MKKDTTKMLEELQNCSEFNDFYKENAKYTIDTTLSEYLNELIKEKDITKAQIIKNAEMSEVYAYQIFAGMRIPDRKKLLCLVFGMGLNLDETQKLLKCTGYSPLYAKLEFDCVVIYGICKRMSIVEVNELLYDYGMETLG